MASYDNQDQGIYAAGDQSQNVASTKDKVMGTMKETVGKIRKDENQIIAGQQEKQGIHADHFTRDAPFGSAQGTGTDAHHTPNAGAAGYPANTGSTDYGDGIAGANNGDLLGNTDHTGAGTGGFGSGKTLGDFHANYANIGTTRGGGPIGSDGNTNAVAIPAEGQPVANQTVGGGEVAEQFAP
ncbi:MAG: hypothetical protein TREMPRED_000028 [Tremellales sp. Tagirdzhanova-0007]|nr:MAG: hypothetical protein TREMPRED_000028 [Tremellales sp. Tagirdzhanova-0007]